MRFRILTYNIHKAIGADRKFRPDRIVDILRHHDADIVLLQEVDRGVPRSDHVDLASLISRELNYTYRAVGMNVFLKRGRYGNATLTRFPIGRQRNIDLTISRLKRRGAQHTSIQLPTRDRENRFQPLDIFNVHLALTASTRRKQLNDLMTTMDMTRLPLDQPCIVAGDMNDWRGILKRQCFAPAGFQCATNRRPGSRWSIKTFPAIAPTGGLDKIFFRGPLTLIQAHRSRLKLAQSASDHLPVIADFDYQ
jgi:endonuclease/exonuclease/phosphatase family metal-dependent hydrolase